MTTLAGTQQRDAMVTLAPEFRPDPQAHDSLLVLEWDRRWLLGVVEKLAGALRVLVAVLEDDDEDIDDRRAYHGAMKMVDKALALLTEGAEGETDQRIKAARAFGRAIKDNADAE